MEERSVTLQRKRYGIKEKVIIINDFERSGLILTEYELIGIISPNSISIRIK